MIFLLLRVVLVARSVLDLAFAWRIHQLVDPSALDLSNAFAPFALADGLAAFVLAALCFVARLPRGLVALAATDTVLRLAAADALRAGPGIPYLAITIVLYVGLLAVFAFLFGIAEELAAREIERELGRNPLSIIVAVAGIVTVILAVVQFVMLPVPSTLKTTLTAGMVLQVLLMLAVAIGVGAVWRRDHRAGSL